MQQFKHADKDNSKVGTHGDVLPAKRSYGQIAEIFTQQSGMEFSPERVRELCWIAERKFSRALARDPAFHEWARLQRACNS